MLLFFWLSFCNFALNCILMAKLQLYISKSHRGYDSLLSINPDEHIGRYVHDHRTALDIVSFDSGKEVLVLYLLRFVEEGLMLSVVRTLESETAGNHLTGTIFVPRGLHISPDDMVSAIENVGNVLLSVGDDALTPSTIAKLREMFAYDYSLKADTPTVIPSHGKRYAYAYFGSDTPDLPTLHDYAKVGFWQPGFSDYAGVWLIRHDKVAREYGLKGRDNATNLSRSKMARTTVVNAPGRSRQGFTPHIYGHLFNASVLLPVGEQLHIEWRCPGFETVEQVVTIVADDPDQIKVPNMSAAVKTISPVTFYISEHGIARPVGSFEIKVNGVVIDGPKPFSYRELANAQVEITAQGYFPFSGSMDLASTTQALVQMRQMHRTYRFDIPLHTPEPSEDVRLYIKSKKPIQKCPIEGYVVAGDGILEGSGVSNKLVYVGGNSRRLIRIGIGAVVVSFLLGMLIGWLAFSVGSTNTDTDRTVVRPETVSVSEESQDKVIQEMAAPQPATVDYGPAVEYLERNKSWKRADMELIAGLAGIFDMMNSYDFAGIEAAAAGPLGQSRNFATVARAAAGAPSKRDPRQGIHGPIYVPADAEQSISWRSYTYWIDP